MKVMTNGEIFFEPGELIPVLTLYRPSNNNPLHFIPKFDEHCICRAFTGGLGPCSKTISFKWYCNKLKKQVYPKICNECQVIEYEK